MVVSLRLQLIHPDMFHFNFLNNRGQTIIEAVVALASILLILGAISVSITTSVSNSQFIKNQSLASKYAQDGIEYIRYIRKTQPVAFDGYSGIYCLNTNPNALVQLPCSGVNIANTFKREAVFNRVHEVNPTPDPSIKCSAATEVTVTVYWSDSKCGAAGAFCHKSQVSSCLSKSRNNNDL